MRALQTDRGTFWVIEEGPSDGPLVMLLHGFPDTPNSFQQVSSHLADAGYRTVAPFMRGYAPSPCTGSFTVSALAADVLAIVNALEVSRFFLVGHDWGAVITWQLLLTGATKIDAAVVMSVPHPVLFLQALSRRSQRRKSAYMALFQLPIVAEYLVNQAMFVEKLWRSWSKSFDPGRGYFTKLQHTLQSSLPGPLLPYRSMPYSIWQGRDVVRYPAKHLIDVPTMCLHGLDDGCIDVDSTNNQQQFFSAHYERHILADCGHFVQLERPVVVAAKLVSFFARFGGEFT